MGNDHQPAEGTKKDIQDPKTGGGEGTGSEVGGKTEREPRDTANDEGQNESGGKSRTGD